MNYAIQVDHLKKSYGGHAVLNDLSFSVRKGECFALLGANGAGKTTTLECMEGLRKYDGGSITVNGKIGIQLQSASLPAHMKAMEAVRLFEKWNRQASGTGTRRQPMKYGSKVADNVLLLDALGIGAFANNQYAKLSTGQKRRLHLALALTGDPDILFLDEPTAGLDVEGRISLHEQIRRFKEQGKTMLLASHDMAEVESLCDRIAILAGGSIAFIGTVEELNERVGKHYHILIKTDVGTEHVETDHIGEALLSLLSHYKEAGTEILDIQVDRGSLEQHVMKIARGN